jgi:hypothetical protein
MCEISALNKGLLTPDYLPRKHDYRWLLRRRTSISTQTLSLLLNAARLLFRCYRLFLCLLDDAGITLADLQDESRVDWDKGKRWIIVESSLKSKYANSIRGYVQSKAVAATFCSAEG